MTTIVLGESNHGFYSEIFYANISSDGTIEDIGMRILEFKKHPVMYGPIRRVDRLEMAQFPFSKGAKLGRDFKPHFASSKSRDIVMRNMFSVTQDDEESFIDSPFRQSIERFKETV